MKKIIVVSLLLATASLSNAAPLDHVHLLRGNSVITDELAPANVKLQAIATESYESVSEAEAVPLATPRWFTLVGEKGSCEVATTKRVFVSRTGSRRPHVELELDTSKCSEGPFELAIDGRFGGSGTSATLILGPTEQGPEIADWVERKLGKTLAATFAQGPKARSAFRQVVNGTSDELVFASFSDGKSELLVKSGDRIIAGFEGWARAIGVIHHCYLRDRLVIQTEHGVRTVVI
jgi:hypothetical protein